MTAVTCSVGFRLDDGSVENMHAKRIHDGTYMLDSIPFYFYGISYGDIFTVEEGGDRLWFSKVLRRSGHSTYRLRLPTGSSYDDFLAHWQELEKFGCSYEGSSAGEQRLYAIDVPRGVDVDSIYRILEKGEQKGWWDFEEGFYFDAENERGAHYS